MPTPQTANISNIPLQGNLQLFSYAVNNGAHDVLLCNQASVDLIHEHQVKMVLFAHKTSGDPSSIAPVARSMKMAVLKNGLLGV